MKTVLFGVVLGVLAAFPHLAVLGAAPVAAASRWLLGEPAVWAFAVGLIVRPRLVRRFTRRLP